MDDSPITTAEALVDEKISELQEEMNYLMAVKKWNAMKKTVNTEHVWAVPRRGTKEYDEVKAMYAPKAAEPQPVPEAPKVVEPDFPKLVLFKINKKTKALKYFRSSNVSRREIETFDEDTISKNKDKYSFSTYKLKEIKNGEGIYEQGGNTINHVGTDSPNVNPNDIPEFATNNGKGINDNANWSFSKIEAPTPAVAKPVQAKAAKPEPKKPNLHAAQPEEKIKNIIITDTLKQRINKLYNDFMLSDKKTIRDSARDDILVLAGYLLKSAKGNQPIKNYIKLPEGYPRQNDLANKVIQLLKNK